MFVSYNDKAIPITAFRTSAVFYPLSENVTKADNFLYNPVTFDEFRIQRDIDNAVSADLDISTRFIDI